MIKPFEASKTRRFLRCLSRTVARVWSQAARPLRAAPSYARAGKARQQKDLRAKHESTQYWYLRCGIVGAKSLVCERFLSFKALLLASSLHAVRSSAASASGPARGLARLDTRRADALPTQTPLCLQLRRLAASLQATWGHWSWGCEGRTCFLVFHA